MSADEVESEASNDGHVLCAVPLSVSGEIDAGNKSAMCVDLCDRENKSEPARRKFTFPIEAYADRIRLKARLELASSEPAMIMFDILAKKRVPLVKATNAVRETLDSATNTGYATQRLENLDMLLKQRLVLLDELISKFSTFVDAIFETAAKFEGDFEQANGWDN